MILREYKTKVNNASSLDQLEKDSIIVMLFNKLAEAALILFPSGIYKQIKWYQFNRWILLGKLMYELIRLIMRRKG